MSSSNQPRVLLLGDSIRMSYQPRVKEMLADVAQSPSAGPTPGCGGATADEADVEIPRTRIASIAKREEDIYVQGSSQPLKLPAHSPVRKLLQYVRDEAHRFAQHYHHILRDKKMLNENR